MTSENIRITMLRTSVYQRTIIQYKMKVRRYCTRKMQPYVTLFLLVHTMKVSTQTLDDDDTPTRNLDVYNNNNQKPVPFGHIFKDGIDDLKSDYKVPYDLLELRMISPKSRHEEQRMLKTVPKDRIINVRDYRLGKRMYVNPRDEYMDDFLQKNGKGTTTKLPDNDMPQWFNFEQIQQANIATTRPAIHRKENNIVSSGTATALNPDDKEGMMNEFLSQDTFDVLRGSGVDKLNWTTCNEFEKSIGPKNLVYPKDIVDMNWEPFYVWSHRRNVASMVHRFSYPTKKIVKEYKQTYGRYLNRSLDWEQPKLVMKEELEILLIAGDRRGLFHGIPKHSLPYSIRSSNFTIPIVDMRLKLEEPYLALMFCDEFYATIMASPGNEPRTDKEKREEAALLKFKGIGYPISRNLYLEKLKVEGIKEMAKRREETKIIRALPGAPGVDI